MPRQRSAPFFSDAPVFDRADYARAIGRAPSDKVVSSMLAQHLPAIQGPIYYLAGPPAMVAAMRHVLADAEVDEDDIRTEEFSGY